MVILTIFLVIAGSIKWIRKLLSWSLGKNMLFLIITNHKILIFIMLVFGILCIFVKLAHKLYYNYYELLLKFNKNLNYDENARI